MNNIISFLSFSWQSPEFYPRSDRGGIAGQGEG